MGASQSHGRHNYIPCHLIPHLIIRESECETLYWTIKHYYFELSTKLHRNGKSDRQTWCLNELPSN